jgi:hypothetical protein
LKPLGEEPSAIGGASEVAVVSDVADVVKDSKLAVRFLKKTGSSAGFVLRLLCEDDATDDDDGGGGGRKLLTRLPP